MKYNMFLKGFLNAFTRLFEGIKRKRQLDEVQLDETTKRKISGLCGYTAIASLIFIYKENRDKEYTQKLTGLIRTFATFYKYLYPKVKREVESKLALILLKEEPTKEGEELIMETLVAIFMNDIEKLSINLLNLKEDIQKGKRKFSFEIEQSVDFIIKTFNTYFTNSLFNAEKFKDKEAKAMEKVEEFVQLFKEMKSIQDEGYKSHIVEELENLRYIYKNSTDPQNKAKIEKLINHLACIDDTQINNAVIDFIYWTTAMNLKNVLTKIAKRNQACLEKASQVAKYLDESRKLLLSAYSESRSGQRW
jgi:hypothetical protein